MVKRYFSNPVFLSVLVLSFIYYSGIFAMPDFFVLNSLIPQDKILKIEGQIINSPVKSSSQKTYSCNLKLERVKGNIESEANGIIKIFIPASIVEAEFPGKLYTKSTNKNNYIYETGGKYIFEGKFIDQNFLVSECVYNNWNKKSLYQFDFIRAKCRLQFKRLMYSWKSAGGLLLALLSGSREYTETTVGENFKNAGLSHILALSGMHLSMFSGIALFIGNKIGRKRISFIIRIIALILFVWFAGFSPSLLRAFICAMLLILAGIGGVENPDMILILCFSFLIQNIMSPSDIKNYGFILSYGALAGILLTGKFFSRLYNFIFPGVISSSLSSSTGAQLFTTPISLKLFGTYAPVGIIASTVISPLITIFIYSGLILIMICMIFPGLVSYSGIFLNFEYTIIKLLVSFFALAPRITI